MKRHILIALTAFLACEAHAQISKGTSFISANGSIYYNPPSKEKSTSNGTNTQYSSGDNKAFSYFGSVSYNRFLKDNLSFGIGIYSNYNEVIMSNQSIYNDSNYNNGRSDQNSRESGINLTMQRFYPLWKDKLFVTFNTALSGGLITADNEDYYKSNNGGSEWSQTNTRKTDGFSSRFTAGAGAYFFLNKHWVLSSSITAFNASFQHYTYTTKRTEIGFSTPTPFVSETKRDNNNFTASLNPFVQPFSLVWGVNYFF